MRSRSFPVVLVVLPALVACNGDSDSASGEPPPDPAPVTVNRGLAVARVIGAGELRLVVASEADQGLDFTGDTDLEDRVVQLFDLATGVMTSTGLAVPAGFRRGRLASGGRGDAGPGDDTSRNDEVPPVAFACNDELAVFQVGETETGRDLDQDGVTDEVSTRIFERRTGALIALDFGYAGVTLGGPLAAFLIFSGPGAVLRVYDARDHGLCTLHLPVTAVVGVQDGRVAFTVGEGDGIDRNADGDTEDFLVLHVFDSETGMVRNTGFDLILGAVRFASDFVGFLASESANGRRDLSGDGDADDTAFVAVGVRTGQVRQPGLVGASFAEFGDRTRTSFLLAVPETGVDRNGDRDTSDLIPVDYDPRTDRMVDTGLAITNGLLVQGSGWIGVPVLEADQGGLDLDGDGLAQSAVPSVFDMRSFRSLSLGEPGFWIGTAGEHLLGLRSATDEDIAFPSHLFAWDPTRRVFHRPEAAVLAVLGSAGNTGLVLVSERDGDRNGDGDRDDFVLGLYEGTTGTVRNLGLATTGSDSRLGPGGRAAVVVSEAAQDEDLNGDGDLGDTVLFEITLGSGR